MQPALVKAMDVEFIFFLHPCWACFLAIRLRAESLKKYQKAPAPNITNLIVVVADLALSESLLDLINSTGSHETPSFSCQLASCAPQGAETRCTTLFAGKPTRPAQISRDAQIRIFLAPSMS